VDCGDRLSAEAAETPLWTARKAFTASPEDNLVIKAAKLLRETFPDRVRGNQACAFPSPNPSTGAGLAAAVPTRRGLQLCNRNGA